MLFVFVHEICIYESLESPTRRLSKNKFHKRSTQGRYDALLYPCGFAAFPLTNDIFGGDKSLSKEKKSSTGLKTVFLT